MSRLPRPGILFALVLVALFSAGLASAADKAQKEQKLKAVMQQIGKLKQAIDVKEDSKSRYITQLKSIERNIGKINRDIRAIGQNIKAKKSELDDLRKKRLEHQKRLSRENQYLAEQVYAAFTLGRQEKVKLLFSQQDPQALQRNLVYYQYFSSARVALIDTVRHSIEQIVATEDLIRQAKLDLEKNRKLLTEQKTTLARDRNKRQSIIGSLDAQLKQQGGDLARLQEEAAQLQKLIDSIQEILDTAPEDEITRKAFAELKGQLAWPVQGKVRRLFGRQTPLSSMRWQGVLIDAGNGRDVRAVSHGRVAFADWLRGFGNLIIIDHGNAYLSLYGHNESLFKSAGEWVEAGDVIASVGNSGGRSEPGLYFEIRKKGKPQNPTRWCKTGNRFASG